VCMLYVLLCVRGVYVVCVMSVCFPYMLCTLCLYWVYVVRTKGSQHARNSAQTYPSHTDISPSYTRTNHEMHIASQHTNYVLTMYAQRTHNVRAKLTQHTYNIHKTCTTHTQHMHTTFTKHTHSICTKV